YKIIVAYDGTDFHGWQIQPKDITVVSTLQNAWHKIFNQNITLIGSSRTDAGVHALGQVARFHADVPAGMTEEQIRITWNASLPKSIVIRSLEKAPERFHPCAN